MKVRITLFGFVILMVAVAGCVAPTAAPAVQPTSPPPTSTPEPEMAAAVTLQVAEDADLGQFLADGEGNTLYLFLNDTPGTSVCYDSCAENWPPLITEGEVEAGEGINADLIGTTERDDGSLQVTYNDWPLYYFVRDEQPGDTTGQDAGDVWYVISPDGEAVGAEEAAVTLQVAEDPDLGQFLVDAEGNTLYLFLNDTPGTSVCYDSCAENWPPLITEGEVEAGEGINPDLIGTTERDDGALQVTYNDWPLYYFVRDEAPGDTAGQDAGDVWYVISPDGEAVGAEEAAVTLQVAADADLGQFLVDAEGNTLYLFLNDSPGTSVCYDSCAENWPPLITEGEVEAGEGINADLIGTTERDDGSLQVTYNDWPLYYFVRDEQPGDTTGQDAGDVWYVISPDGEAVGAEEAAVTLQVAEDPDLGQFLVDAEGNTLYLFLNDSPGTSVCYDSCAENWPPLISEGEVEAGEGVNPDLIGTTERDDGALQVTYNDWPLYYFVRDEQPGDTTGQDAGDVWYVISPDGEAVGAEEEM